MCYKVNDVKTFKKPCILFYTYSQIVTYIAGSLVRTISNYMCQILFIGKGSTRFRKYKPVIQSGLPKKISFFIVMTHNLSVNCSSYFFYFVLNDPIKVPILRLSSALVKICRIPHVIFQTTSHFFFKFCITCQFHERQLFCTFFRSNIKYFAQHEPMKFQIIETFESSGQIFRNSCHF